MKTSSIKILSILIFTIISSEVLSQGLKVETQFYFDSRRNETAFGKDDIPNNNTLNGQAFAFAFWDDKMMVACRTEKTNNLSEHIKDTEITIHILNLEGNILNTFTVSNPSGLGIKQTTGSLLDLSFDMDLSATADDQGNIFIAFEDHIIDPLYRKCYLFKYSERGKKLWSKTFSSDESHILYLKPLREGCVAIRSDMIEVYDESVSPQKQTKADGNRPNSIFIKDNRSVYYHVYNGNSKRGYVMEILNVTKGSKTNIELGNQKIIDYELIVDGDENIIVYLQTMEKRKLEGDEKPQKYYDGSVISFNSSGRQLSNDVIFSDKKDKGNFPSLIITKENKIISCSGYKFSISDLALKNTYSETNFVSPKVMGKINQLDLEYLDQQKFIFSKKVSYDYHIAVVSYKF